MSTFAIFFLGLLVTGMAAMAVILIGLGEAGDPAHSRFDDLSSFERSRVNRNPEVDDDGAYKTE